MTKSLKHNKVPVKIKSTKSKEHAKFRSTSKWKNWRKYLLEKRNYTCEISGFKRKKGLQIHHLDDSNYEDLREDKFVILTPANHKLVERLLCSGRAKNSKFDIDDFCDNLKRVYNNSMRGTTKDE